MFPEHLTHGVDHRTRRATLGRIVDSPLVRLAKILSSTLAYFSVRLGCCYAFGRVHTRDKCKTCFEGDRRNTINMRNAPRPTTNAMPMLHHPSCATLITTPRCSPGIPKMTRRQPGDSGHETLPGLGSTWRDKLLLQALRETGEEMKRRRQTHREVRARRAVEEEEVAIRDGRGGGGSASSHGSSHGSGSFAVATLQAGGEGRWKPPLSRQVTSITAASAWIMLRFA